jgi:plasmid replication DNA-binding protein KfrA
MVSQKMTYGTGRHRGATVSYAEIERAARDLMANGGRPTVEGVHKALGRGSPNHISVEMQKFWKNQSALNGSDPLALTRLPPELADAAVAQWEQALRLALQNATDEDNAARAHLEQLRRDMDARAHSVELREKECDMAARVRERALADTREQVNLLMGELAADRAELRFRDARIGDLEAQIEAHRQQLARVVTRTVTRNRALKTQKPSPRSRKSSTSKTRIHPKKRPQSKRPKPRAQRYR